MGTELVVLPSAQALKDRLKVLWSWQTNRSAVNALALLEREYEGIDIALPAIATLYGWISREKWGEQADQELAQEYPLLVRQLKRDYLTNLLLANQRYNEALLGLRPMDKDLVAYSMHREKMFGFGTLGANQGGEMGLNFTLAEAEEEVLSLEQRARRMRAMMSERARKDAS